MNGNKIWIRNNQKDRPMIIADKDGTTIDTIEGKKSIGGNKYKTGEIIGIPLNGRDTFQFIVPAGNQQKKIEINIGYGWEMAKSFGRNEDTGIIEDIIWTFKLNTASLNTEEKNELDQYYSIFDTDPPPEDPNVTVGDGGQNK